MAILSGVETNYITIDLYLILRQHRLLISKNESMMEILGVKHSPIVATTEYLAICHKDSLWKDARWGFVGFRSSSILVVK